MLIVFVVIAEFVNELSASILQVSLGTFTVYVLIDPENALTAEKAFVATSLFGILSWTLNVLPHIVNRFVQVSKC